MQNPAIEYKKRLSQSQHNSSRLERSHLWLGFSKISIYIAILVLGWYTGKTGSIPGLIFLFSAVAVLATLLIVHERVLHNLDVSKRRSRLYQRGLDRLEGR